MTTLPDTTPTTPPPPVIPPVAIGPSPAPAPASAPDPQEQITRLRRELEDANYQAARYQERMRAAEGAHRADVATIGAALIAEAKERNWCTEYDEFIERLNQELAVELPTRARAWEVIVPLRVTVRVEEARSEDEAVDRAREIAEDLESCLRRNDQVVTADTDSYHDFEASEIYD